MNRQLLSQTAVVLFALTLALPHGFAAGSGIEDMEPPFGSGYTPEQESQKLANKGYRSYQQALYYQSLWHAQRRSQIQNRAQKGT